MFLTLNKDKNSGFMFLEILVAIAIISLVFVVLLGIGFSAQNTSTSLRKETQADSLAREAFEAVRSFRDGTTWSANGLGIVNYAESNPYYLFLDNSSTPAKWSLRTGTETVGIFTRYIVFDKVSRDPTTHYIESVYNSSHNDPDTVKATVTVLWSDKTARVVSYFTNWK